MAGRGLLPKHRIQGWLEVFLEIIASKATIQAGKGRSQQQQSDMARAVCVVNKNTRLVRGYTRLVRGYTGLVRAILD